MLKLYGILAFFGLAAVLTVSLVSGQDTPSQLEGIYAISGTADDGSAYSGWVEIIEQGELFNLQWETPCGVMSIGQAIRDGDVLSVIFQTPKGLGLAQYTYANGKWKGLWAAAGGTDVYPETLTREKRTLEQLRAQACEKPAHL